MTIADAPLAGRYAAAFAAPAGPGDARPTALQIVQDEGLVGKLCGKVFLVTGCSSGIGVETTRALHATGADVYFTVRNVVKGKDVLADIKASNSLSKGKLELIEMEMGSLASVRAAAADFIKRSQTLNVLVNNAGVITTSLTKTVDGFEQQFGVNHLAHFLLFQLLKPLLLKSATPEFPSRVVAVSSAIHRYFSVSLDDYNFEKNEYSMMKSYGQAKTANIWFANELDRRYGSRNLHATSLMPGGINTPMTQSLGPSLQKQWEDPKMKALLSSTEQGAATSVWAAIGAEWAHKGGKYLDRMEEAPAADPNNQSLDAPGYAPHAYNPEGEKQLWEDSLKLVGMQ